MTRQICLIKLPYDANFILSAYIPGLHSFSLNYTVVMFDGGVRERQAQ